MFTKCGKMITRDIILLLKLKLYGCTGFVGSLCVHGEQTKQKYSSIRNSLIDPRPKRHSL